MRLTVAGSTLSWSRNGQRTEIEVGKDALLRADAMRAQTDVEAPVVFAGFGITAPAQQHDDYKDIDAKGKIVAVMLGAPAWESALKAHYSSSLQKLRMAVAHGAVGLIMINDPTLERIYPFTQRVRDLVTPALRWLDSDGTPHNHFPQLGGTAVLSMEATKHLFEGAPYSAEQIYATAQRGSPPAFALPGLTARLHTVTQARDATSSNVVAVLPGSDPRLAREYVVYSAHLDHIGIGVPENGDAIYNGTLDNASGSAILLEIARAFAGQKPAPRRSILFVAVTGEEAGLIGSDYFANKPTVDKSAIIANINVDEDQMLWPLQDIVAYGAEHSSLERDVKWAAGRLHLQISPDPEPEQVTFVRSDQYSFVQQGVPSVMPSPGLKSDDPRINPAALLEEWESHRYHHAADDMNQPGLDFESAARFATLAHWIGVSVAQRDARPAWKSGDFFGEQFARRSVAAGEPVHPGGQ